MNDFSDNIARLLFEKDLEDIRFFAEYCFSSYSDSVEGVVIERLKSKGYSVNDWEFFLALAIWECNTFVNSHLYTKTGIFAVYQDALKKHLCAFCEENKIPYQLFQEIESIYHWKSTRKYAAEYSSPLSISFKNNLDEEVEFNNYWDVCTPIDSSIISVGLFLHDLIDIDALIIDKDFLERIEQIDLRHNYVEIVENNLRRNLVETLFYSVQSDKQLAKLVFEALETFIPNTFDQKVESITAPLTSIIGFCHHEFGHLLPMQLVKHEFSPDLNIVFADLMNDRKTGQLHIEGSMSSLVGQWSKWRWIIAPPDDLCNMVFALVLCLQDGREDDYYYFYKKLPNLNCQSFLEDAAKLKNICASIDAETIDTYLRERVVDYGFAGYVNEEGLWHVSGPARDINTIVCDLRIPPTVQQLTEHFEDSLQQKPQSEPEQLSPADFNQVIPDSLTTEHKKIIKEFEIGKRYFTEKNKNRSYELRHCTIINEGFNSMADEDKANRFKRLIQLVASKRFIYPSTRVMRSCAYAMTGYGFNNPFEPVPVFWNPKKVDELFYICQRFYNKRGDAKTPMSNFKNPAEVFHVIKEYQEISNRSQSASKVDTDDFGKDFKEIFPEL